MSKIKDIYEDAKNIHNNQVISDEEQYQIDRFEIELNERQLFLSEFTMIESTRDLTYHSR